jgi:hypothetical protein
MRADPALKADGCALGREVAWHASEAEWLHAKAELACRRAATVDER